VLGTKGSPQSAKNISVNRSIGGKNSYLSYANRLLVYVNWKVLPQSSSSVAEWCSIFRSQTEFPSISPPQRSDHAMLHWQIRMMSVFLFHLSAFHVSGGRRGGVLVENNCQSMQLHILRRILSGGCCSTNYNPLHIFICSPAKWAVVL